MPIEFRCDDCSKLVRAPDNAAGKRAKCPQCGKLLVIPAASSASLGEGHPTPPPEEPPALPEPPTMPPVPRASSLLDDEFPGLSGPSSTPGDVPGPSPFDRATQDAPPPMPGPPFPGPPYPAPSFPAPVGPPPYGGMAPMPYGAPMYVGPPPADSGSGVAVASMVLGLIALLTSFCGCILSPLTGILGLVGLVLGIAGLKSSNRGMAIAGIVMSAISLLAILGMIIFMMVMLASSPEFQNM